MNGGTLRLALLQFAPALRDPVANAARIAYAAGADVDLLVTPELSLTGYDLGDAVHDLAVPLAEGGTAPYGLNVRPDVLVGLVELGADGVPYNTAAYLHAGRVAFRHRKLYLPTYGMFDEGRYFGRGRRLRTVDAASGWRVGVLVCEDLWHPALPYLLAAQGVHLLVVMAAAPGRGAWEGVAQNQWASWDVWERIARVTAQLYGVYVALANRTGVEGGVTFAGGSMIVGPDGELLVRAGEAEEILTATLRIDEVLRARRPYAHTRDEDLAFVHGEIGRLLDAG